MEQWRQVTGYDGFYDVSNLGEVRSRHKSYRPRLRGDLLTPGLSSGKRTVVLYGKNGKRQTRVVAHLVLEEFAGPRPPDYEACHGPGGPLDDSEVNLCWGSRAKNQGPDRVRDGTSNRGERQWQARLTEEIVMECRRRYAAGESQMTLATEFGVTGSGISTAITGATWGWLPGAVPIDRSRHGTRGTAHPGARLTPEVVREARSRHAAGESQLDLAREYGVAKQTLQHAISGHTWKHI